MIAVVRGVFRIVVLVVRVDCGVTVTSALGASDNSQQTDFLGNVERPDFERHRRLELRVVLGELFVESVVRIPSGDVAHGAGELRIVGRRTLVEGRHGPDMPGISSSSSRSLSPSPYTPCSAAGSS